MTLHPQLDRSAALHRQVVASREALEERVVADPHCDPVVVAVSGERFRRRLGRCFGCCESPSRRLTLGP
jgi:hypothetical protein